MWKLGSFWTYDLVYKLFELIVVENRPGYAAFPAPPLVQTL